jgi:hypothetical protein
MTEGRWKKEGGGARVSAVFGCFGMAGYLR